MHNCTALLLRPARCPFLFGGKFPVNRYFGSRLQKGAGGNNSESVRYRYIDLKVGLHECTLLHTGKNRM